MKLNITLTIKAPDSKTAESLAMEALAEMTLKAGCFVATGNGDTTAMSAELYKVTIEMEMSNSERLQEAVQELNTKPYMVSAFVFACDEEKKEAETEPAKSSDLYRCDECDALYDKEDGVFINPGKENEYFLCNSCLEDAAFEGTVWYCEEGEHYVSSGIENPVTHKKNICPICGSTMF